MRKPIIAGNWKMNKTLSESLKLIDSIKKHSLNGGVEVIISVPFTALSGAKKALGGTRIGLAGQNMHWEDSGAYTGEISPLMLKDIGVNYCIIGHSERRQYLNETDEIVNKKVKSALRHGIKPIICVGETLEEKENGKEEIIVRMQVLKALEGIGKEYIDKLIIAYEPIWAIGTGKTASSEDANHMCRFIRGILGEKFDERGKDSIRVLYGGSVKPSNIKDLMSKEDIDGALVGGASLVAEDFIKLVNY